MPREKHVAFSVSGGCFFYQMGIAYFIQQHFDTSEVKFSGASGGSWPAALLAANIDVKKALEVILKYAPHCVEERSWKALGAYGVYDKGIAIAFDVLFKDLVPSLADRVNNRLAISVTRLAWTEAGTLGLSRPYFKDEVVSQFHSNDDILQCIVASALIPFALNGKPFVRYRNWICADGGITNVSGVRRFAAELAHDLGRIEEGIEEMLEEGLEQAHRLSRSYTSKIHELDLNSKHLTSLHENAAHFLLHDTAPISSGPYGVLQIPIDVTRKVSTGVLHTLSRTVSAGVNSITNRIGSVCTLLSSCGIDLERMSSTSSTAVTSRRVSSTVVDSYACENASFDSSYTTATDALENELSEYPSWPVPGMLYAGSQSKDDFVDISNDSKCSGKKEILLIAPGNLKVEDGVVREDSTYWRVKTPMVSKIPNGGLQLEISPWMWRHQPVLNYHLSSDPVACRRLFEMGMVDAAEHHFDLMKFFSPDEYMVLSHN